MTLVNHEDFKRMREELADFDQKREELITGSRKLLTLAKKTIYETHRNHFEQAHTTQEEATIIANLLKKAIKEDYRYKIGAVTAALQEWGESIIYYAYAKESRLLTREETGLTTEDYLLALADVTGELTRRAVIAMINNNREEVLHIRSFVEELLGEFLSFDFRNGELRKKTDSVRWNLQKIEELLVRNN